MTRSSKRRKGSNPLFSSVPLPLLPPPFLFLLLLSPPPFLFTRPFSSLPLLAPLLPSFLSPSTSRPSSSFILFLLLSRSVSVLLYSPPYFLLPPLLLSSPSSYPSSPFSASPIPERVKRGGWDTKGEINVRRKRKGKRKQGKGIEKREKIKKRRGKCEKRGERGRKQKKG